MLIVDLFLLWLYIHLMYLQCWREANNLISICAVLPFPSLRIPVTIRRLHAALLSP